jgi:hypothetical protein
MVYAIADANEYLVITGSGIEDVKITKKAWVWPFQRCSRISVLPDDYSSRKISGTLYPEEVANKSLQWTSTR